MLSFSNSPRSQAAFSEDQRGFALIEVVVAMMIIGLLVGALTTGLITTMRSASSANKVARSNVLLTSFEETLQQIDYRPCTDGDVVALYTAAFNDYESGLPAAQRIVGPSGQVSATIVSADTHGGCTGGSADSGKQSLGLEVTYRGTTRAGTMVKRNPAPAEGPVADFNATVESFIGDPLGIVALDGSNSTPQAALIEYRWECGDPAGTVFVSDPPDNPQPDERCTYNATGASEDYTITLTVTDAEGVTNSTSRLVTIPAASSPPLPPAAVINTSCGASSPCPAGNSPLTVNFDGTASNSLDGTIVSHAWDFGDPLSGTANSSSDAVTSHVFTRDQIHQVKLTVTDSFGLTGIAFYNIDVTVVGPPPPTAIFAMSIQSSTAPSPRCRRVRPW